MAVVIWLPPSHTLLYKTRNRITAIENVVGNIIFQPLSNWFHTISADFWNPFSLSLTCADHLIYWRLLGLNSLYWSKVFSQHLEGLLSCHLVIPPVWVFFEWDHHRDNVFLAVRARQVGFDSSEWETTVLNGTLIPFNKTVVKIKISPPLWTNGPFRGEVSVSESQIALTD